MRISDGRSIVIGTCTSGLWQPSESTKPIEKMPILPVGKSDTDFDDADTDLQIAIGINVEKKSMREERMMCEAVKNSLQSLDDDSARASMLKTFSSQTQQRSVKTCDSHVKILLKRVALLPAGNQLMWSGSKIIYFPGQTTVAVCVKKFLQAFLGSHSEHANGGDHVVIVIDGTEVASAKDRRLKMASNHIKLSDMFKDRRSEAQIYILVRPDDYDKSDLMSQAEYMVKQQVSIKNGELLLQDIMSDLLSEAEYAVEQQASVKKGELPMREKVGVFKNRFRELKEENRGLKEQLCRL